MNEENKEKTKKWIRKAEEDLKVAKDEINTFAPATDMVCYHAQQTIEKVLKAFLIFHNKRFRKTHDISELIELCSEIDKEFENLIEEKEILRLNFYATEVRYPEALEYGPDIEEAKEAIEIAEKVKEFVLKKLKEKGYE